MWKNNGFFRATPGNYSMSKMRLLAFFAGWSVAAVTAALAQSHQGSLYSCEGRPISGVEHLDVAVPPEGRSYGWPANTVSIHRWGSEILVGFRDYPYRWKGYWQHTMFSDAVDTNDCRNVLARSPDNGRTWRTENPPGYSDYDRSHPDVRDCATLPAGGVPFGHPDFVFESVWMEHTSDETRHFFHWSTDRGRTWSARYRLPMLNGYGHLEPRTDYLVENATTALVFVSGDNMTTPARPPWAGAWISAYHTTDGGRTWTASQVGERTSGIWKGMTSSVRVGPNEILTAVRDHRVVNKPHPGRIQSLADVYASTDNGATWRFRSTPWVLEENVFGNPASLVALPSGKLVALMGNRRSSAQSQGGHLVSKLQCRVSADRGRTWGPIHTIRDNLGTWDTGYQRAVVREDGKVLVVYYHADRRGTEGPFHGEGANHRVPRRIAASIFDADFLDTTPVPIDPYRKLEATAADFGTVQWHTNFFVTGFDAGKHFVFQGLRFDRGLSEIKLALGTSATGRRIEIRHGSMDGPLLATLTTTATGSDLTFQEQTVETGNLTGRRDIYFVSRDTAAANIDYVQFIPQTSAATPGVYHGEPANRDFPR
jgi:hypothetical protein